MIAFARGNERIVEADLDRTVGSARVRNAKDSTMGQSFYRTRNYALLRNASQVFSDLINATPTAYGLTAPQAAAYETLNNAYAAKYETWFAPETKTRAAMLGRNTAAEALRTNAAMLAKLVEAAPAVTDEQKEQLGLSVRSTPTPLPPPGTCNDFKAVLLGDGSVKLTWKANNPTGMSGVTYQIWRRFGSEGEFSYAGACGEKKYVDSSIPAGTPQVQYQIRGIRPTAAGGWAQFNVNFGQAPSGATFASVVETNVSPKLAA